MKFRPTPLGGAFLVEIAPTTDERGFFARTWAAEEASARGLIGVFEQHSISFNRLRGTLRGMHYQTAPAAETKVVRCTAGAIYDVIVDLRSGSATFKRWFAAELTADNRTALYVPEGLAHGFITLSDSAEVLYQITPAYAPHLARGVRYDDPAFGIHWPLAPIVISERDSSFAPFAS